MDGMKFSLVFDVPACLDAFGMHNISFWVLNKRRSQTREKKHKTASTPKHQPHTHPIPKVLLPQPGPYIGDVQAK